MTRRTTSLSIFIALFTFTSAAHAQRRAEGNAVGYEMEGAAIPQGELDQLPARVNEALAACGAEAAPWIGRTQRASLTVSPPGQVTGVGFDGEPSSAEAGARQCVERALRTLRFPRRGRATTLVLDIAFREARGSSAETDPRTAAYRESVVRAIETHQPAVHACFERSRRALESPERRLRVELTIDAQGRPRAAVPAGDLFPQLTECLTREIQRWTLPRPPTAPFPMDHRFDGDVAAYGN